MLSEPVLFLVLLLAPFVLGFDDVDAARNVSIGAAIVVLVATLMTDWPLSVVRAIPLKIHGVLDIVVGLLLIIAPFAIGYSDDSTAATVVHIVLGLGFVVAGFMTNWTHAHDRAAARHGSRAAR
jgi:hypothetical protein